VFGFFVTRESGDKSPHSKSSDITDGELVTFNPVQRVASFLTPFRRSLRE